MAGATRPDLGAALRRARGLMAISRDAVLVVRHADHRIVEANAAAARLYGLTEPQLCALSYDELLTDRQASDDIFARHREHVPLRYHRRADGARFPVEMAIHWVDSAEDGELGLFRVRDLSRSEADEKRLRAAENSYLAIFRSAPFPILLLDRSGTISDANDAALRLYGHTALTLCGQPVACLLQDERQAQQYFRHSHWQSPDLWQRRRDGALFMARVTVSNVRLSAQVQAIVVVQDITEERALLERLQASEARWRFALEGHGDALWEWDLARERVHVSRQFSQQLGTGAQPTEQTPGYWAALVHADDRARLQQALLQHIKGHSALIDIEVRLQPQDGAARWVWLRGRVVERQASGRALRLLGSVRDVDAQKRQAEELAHWREQVQHTARLTSLGELAATLAHELNQPLTSIRNFSAALRHRFDAAEGCDPVELRRVIGLIADESMRAGRILQHIRGFVRKGTGRAVALDLHEVIGNVQQLAEIQARRIGASIALLPGAPVAPVLADPVLTEQLLLNLVSNGLEAMRHSGTERRIEISTATTAEGMIEVRVRDHGRGLPAEPGLDIYAPFVTTRSDGLGMGLAICRSIVESHHGRLWADAHPQLGTVFHFTLPPAPEHPDDTPAPHLRRR